MISHVNMAAYILSVIIVLVVGVVLFHLLKSKSKALETGHVGAAGYGITGYLWGGLLFPFIFASVFSGVKLFSVDALPYSIVYTLLNSIISAFFILMANAWGVYLTNQKQRSLYRSSAVGLGFGFANAIIITGIALQVAIFVNRGSSVSKTINPAEFAKTPTIQILALGIKLAMVIIFYAYVSLILGRFINEKAWKQAILNGMIYYTGFHFILESIEQLLPQGISEGISILTMLAVGAVCFWKIRKILFQKSVQ